jgi:hypothetical protein
MSDEAERPYLITSLNEMPGKERWVTSALRACADSVQPVILMWQPEFAVPEGWIVHRMGRPYPGHLQKLWPLLEMDLDPRRWFVFTDGSDVLFQTRLPALMTAGRRILLSGEGIRHRESAFWAPHLQLPWFAALGDAPVYNVGSWAAVGGDFLEFVGHLRRTATACREQGLPLVDVHEQLIYNAWVQAHAARCGELPGLFCTLYANFTGSEPGGRGTARLAAGRFVDAQGRPYAIVHANGSTKALLDRLVPPGPVEAAERRRTGE